MAAATPAAAMADTAPHRSTPASRVSIAAAWLAACFLLAYGFDIGKGFIKDDYGWLAHSQIGGWTSIRQMFTTTPMGFYRPLVSLSFGLNWALSQSAASFAITNVLFALGIAAGVFQLARRLGLGEGFALFAAAVWAFNFHGINMSLLWISGRTSLLGTLFAVWAAVAFVSSRFVVAGVLTCAALLSKEEPLLLPVVFALWRWLDGVRGRELLVSVAPSFAAVAVYLALRSLTPALTPATAPDYYRLSLGAAAANVIQYADRSMTLVVAVCLLVWGILSRQRIRLTSDERTLMVKGLAWLVCGFSLTLLLPVRSSLYVLLPSIGAGIAGATVAGAGWRAVRHRQAVIAILLLLPVALLPLYHARNQRTKREALLATHALDAIKQQIAIEPTPRIVVVSPAGARPSMADAFATALPDALDLFVPDHRTTTVDVIEEMPQQSTAPVFEVVGDRLERARR